MQTLSIGELKSTFSEVLKKVKNGEEIIISYGKSREKVAVMIPYSVYTAKPGRNLGLLKGRAELVIHDDFEMTEEELLAS
jgi:prevent-host-death family protein